MDDEKGVAGEQGNEPLADHASRTQNADLDFLVRQLVQHVGERWNVGNGMSETAAEIDKRPIADRGKEDANHKGTSADFAALPYVQALHAHLCTWI